ncbi:branched-chain amino acid ABC transporter permease [Desulfobacula sp.]|uniref:branched-chain amino acid ABC transporter permease n=1 Tax=Desulfobacula sp. TaxID=2593537 RepID=UPI002619C4A9|nr:branched-chain amino acid ABC transporter permease [Desulfobacula sp.]
MTDILNAIVLLLNFVFLPGLSYGSQLALGALAVTLVYAILRFANFAQGDTMALSTVMTILLTWLLQHFGITLGFMPTALLALPLAIIGCLIYIMLVDTFVYRYYRRQKSKPITIVMASVGVMFVTGGIVRFVLGPDHHIFADGERFIITAREFKAMTGLAEGLAIKTSQFLTITIAILLVGFVFYFLQRTKTGKAMRAYADNEDLALLSGIEPHNIVRVTWILVAILTTIAGVLYGLDKGFMATSYHQLLLPTFAAVIVGGIGSPPGAIIGGFVISFSELILTYAYKKFFIYLLPEILQPDSLLQFLGTEYKFAVSFVILVIVLLLRPTGIFKGKVI